MRTNRAANQGSMSSFFSKMQHHPIVFLMTLLKISVTLSDFVCGGKCGPVEDLAAMVLKIVILEARSRIIGRGLSLDLHVKTPADKRWGNQQWFQKLSDMGGIRPRFEGFGGGGGQFEVGMP